MLRKIYYLLSPSLRLLVRRLVFLPLDLWKPSKELMPPKGMIYTGGGNFKQQGEQWIRMFKQYGKLNEQTTVLDIGSGIGRIAIAMTPFLKANYEGFDAVEQGVNWCAQNISKQYPNFSFTYVNLFNDLYKSNGVNAATFKFPYKANYFNFACAILVFTHLQPNELTNYLSQTYNVLATNGYFIATFFILDNESKKLMQNDSTFNFKHLFGHYALMDKEVKAANVAFDETYLLDQINKAGFTIETQIKGYWCGREKTNNNDFQDILVLKKQ